MKGILLFLAVTITIFFLNDKFSKAVRVIAFKEDESKKGAIYSFLMMCAAIILWTLYLYFY
jgi:hypothetical protein